MILVLTKSLLEINSDLVIDWLEYYQADHAVLTGDDLLLDTPMVLHLDNETEQFKIGNGKQFPVKGIKAVWFRRRVDDTSFLFYENLRLDTNAKHSLLSHLKTEFVRFYSLLPVLLKEAHWLCHPDKSFLNKLQVLIMAKRYGLTIPETIVTNFLNKNELENKSKNAKYITKPLSETTVITEENLRYSMLTQELELSGLSTDTIIFPSLIQKCIEKEFEIRTFFLSGKCYSMAIFSQESEKTKTDYRNYDDENENRCVPYKLPSAIEKKIRKLMGKLKLNSGSIDFIKTDDNDFVFLEINPVGQFDWVSLNCNYAIEKDIAAHLIKKDNHEKRTNKSKTDSFIETIGA